MKKQILIKLLALCFASCMPLAQASTLTIGLPNNSLNYATNVGSYFDAGIYAAGFPDLSGFEFSITFDNTHLSLASFNSASIFGTGPNDTAYFLTDTNNVSVPYTLTTVGHLSSLNFAEAISGLSSVYPALTATSGYDATSSTLLGTLHFQAIATGANNLVSIAAIGTNQILSDFNGNGLSGNIQPAYVSIAAAVPLPSAFWLFVPGLLAVFGRKSK